MKYFIIYIWSICLFGVSYTQELLEHHLSDCDINSFAELVKNRVSKIKLEDDTLSITLGFSANCCIELDPIIKFKSDTLYVSKNNVSNNFCMCNCCFEMDLKLNGITDTNIVVIVDNEEFKFSNSPNIKLPDEYIFDSKTPINRGNKNNLKIGLWRTYYENSKKIKIEEYFSEEWEDPIRVWFKTYDDKGKLTSIGIRTTPTGNMIILEPTTYYRLLNNSKN